VKRQGLVAAGLIGSAASVCVLLNQHLHLGAAEDGKKSFREALKGAPEPQLVEAEDGIRLNYFDASWDRVLKNLAESSKLTLVMEKTPPGRFARRDRTRYDVKSAVRILNSELEPLGYRLLHQNGFLIVLNLDQARTEYARPRLNAESSEPRSPVTRQFVRNTGSGSEELSVDEPLESAIDEADAPAPPRPATRGAAAAKAAAPKTATRTPSIVTARAEESSVPAGSKNSRSSRIRPVSATQQETAAKQAAAETAAALAADESPLKTEEIPLQQGSASDVARTLYVVFRNRAELEKPGLGGFPGYVVKSNPVEGSSDSEPVVLFRVGIDQDSNSLLIEAPQRRLPHLRKLVTDLDRPAEGSDESAVKLVPNNGIPAQTARQLNDRIHQLVTMADEARAQEPADSRLPADDKPESEGGPAVNLRGEVNVQAMQDLGLLILKGNAADVERVEQIIQQLEKVSVGSLPGIHVLTLQNVDSEAMATLLTSVYEELSEQRQRTGTDTRQAAAFIPVVQPNALLIISSEIERETILELAEELDQPLSPDLEFEVFPLKSAIASQVVTSLTEFYADRPGLGTSLRTFADVRTNSVVVQARPNELAEVRKLIARIDIDDPASTSQMKVIRLKNAVAEELSTTINQAIQAVISPPQQTTGQQGAGGFGGNQQGAQQLRDNKSVAVEFLASAGGIQQLIRSGILADVRVSFDARSNSLILAAPEASMSLLEALVAELDQTPGAISEIKVFSLKNADAQQSVDLLTTLFENTNQEDQLGVQLAGTEGSSSSLIPLRFSADIRTNTVLAIGSAESLSVVEAVLLRLDSDDTRQRSTSVIPLRNAPAEQVSVTLLDFLEQQQALQDSSEDLLSNIERLRQEVLVAPDINSNSLIVSASPQYFNQIVQIIEQLDAQPPEVVIQALLVEVTLDATDEFGIELGFQDPLLLDRSLSTTTAGGTTSISAGPGLNFNNTSIPLGGNYITGGTNPSTVATQGLSNFSLGRSNTALGFGGFVFSAQSDAVSVLLRALAARRTVQVLSRPQVRTTHNNEAYVTVGQQVPIVQGATPNNFGASPNITPQQVGITLRVTPRITPDGIIAMSVFADKSSVSDVGVPVFINGDGSAIESPIINQSQAVTVVNVPNGQTIVMGGMITKSDSTLERKVPWLGDLPIVGRAFRYDGTTTSRTELLIFLTPRIVLSDVDSELLKQVEAERLHFIESDAEQLHGPLYSVPGQDVITTEPEAGAVLSPEMPIRELLEPDTTTPPHQEAAPAPDKPATDPPPAPKPKKSRKQDK
jgi:general secretion pathway protein D